MVQPIFDQDEAQKTRRCVLLAFCLSVILPYELGDLPTLPDQQDLLVP